PDRQACRSRLFFRKVSISSEVVLFRRTLFLSDFQTDIIQNGGWWNPSPRIESVCIGGCSQGRLFGDIVFRIPWALDSHLNS
ncbi:MAG: hypothetical protein ACK5TU_18135, partial [Cyclobacteriaceae bacterium]